MKPQFLTAIIAFAVSGLIAMVISLGGNFMIFVFVAFAVFMAIHTHVFFKKRQKYLLIEDEDTISEKDETEKVLEKCKRQV